MAELPKLALLLGLYGGPGLLALLVLLAGAWAARSRASVLAVACLAGVLVALQAASLYFLSDMGRAWSGGGGRDGILVAGGAALALLGAAAIPVFVARKRAGEGEAPPPATARAASIVVALFLLVYLASSLLRANASSGASMLLYPRFWLVVAGSAAAAWGLWRHASWAWWLALAGAAWELSRFGWRLVADPGLATYAITSVAGLQALLLGLAVLLLLPRSTRDACLR